MEIKIIVSMDWEGTDLKEENLEAIREFKRSWAVPMVHFHNPAYYTNPYLSEEEVQKFTDEAIGVDDEVGLHLHTPRHLLTHAGVSSKTSPCFSRLGDYNVGEQYGQEVMLLAYHKEEIKKLLDFSIRLFKEKGFSPIHSFRAGGWMADERVWEALAEVGIPIDSSATHASYLDGTGWSGENLQRYIPLIWGEEGKRTRPYQLQSFSGPLLEIPNNLGAIDYWDSLNIYQIFASLLNEEQESEQIFVINSHQETAARFMPSLMEFLSYLRSSYGDQLSFTTNRDILHDRLTQKRVSNYDGTVNYYSSY